MAKKKPENHDPRIDVLRKFIEERRARTGLNMLSFEKDAGIGRGRLSDWINGATEYPQLDLILDLLEYFEIDLLELISASEDGATKEQPGASPRLREFLDRRMVKHSIAEGKLGPLELHVLRALDRAGCFREGSPEVEEWAADILEANGKAPQ